MRQTASRWKMNEACEKSRTMERELLDQLASYQGLGRVRREWWNDLLPYFDHDSSFACALRAHVQLGGDAYARLSTFREGSGLAYLVGAEFKTLIDARDKAVKAAHGISDAPDDAEILEGSNCNVCRSYFFKTGPVCRHCKLQVVLKAYEKCLYGYRRSLKTTVNAGSGGAAGKGRKGHKKRSKKQERGPGINSVPDAEAPFGDVDSGDEIEVKQLDREQIDGPFVMIAKQMRLFATRLGRRDLAEVAAAEIRWLAALEVELRSLNMFWNRHLELLKAHDELAMCISRVQLATGAPDEDGGQFLQAFELEDSAAEAMSAAIVAESDLKASIGTFNFYREQEAKIRKSTSETHGGSATTKLSLTVSPISNRVHSTVGAGTGNGSSAVDGAALRKWQQDMDDDCCIICREPLFESASDTPPSHPATSDNAADGKVEAVLLPCAHIFHKKCICQWMEKREACVICKARTKVADLITIERPDLRRPTQVRSYAIHTNVIVL